MDCTFPAKIPAGLTFSRLVTLGEFPAPAWSMSLLLRGPESIDLVAVPEGTGHRIVAPASETAAWAPGVYQYALRASSAGTILSAGAGRTEITPDMATLAPGAVVLTQAARTLLNINAVLEKRASQDQQRYVINNRELWRTPLADLMKLRDYYANIVRREERAACGCSQWGPAVRVRF